METRTSCADSCRTPEQLCLFAVRNQRHVTNGKDVRTARRFAQPLQTGAAEAAFRIGRAKLLDEEVVGLD